VLNAGRRELEQPQRHPSRHRLRLWVATNNGALIGLRALLSRPA
jgi:hypothetical protein